jgi:protein-S-isoprenylcysteine O-methyltransferase Ste14
VQKLANKAFFGIAQLIAVLAILLFAPAGTLRFWQAWAYLLVFGTSSALITTYLWKKDKRLLQRRIDAGPRAEKEHRQKLIQLLASVVFLATIALPSLDHHFLWSSVSVPVVIAGDIVAALGFLIVLLVFRENTFAAATIGVTADQTIVTTGPYALVRHPMYSGALVLLFGTPLALGSWWGLLMFIPMVFIIGWRARDEERLLLKYLSGYATYCRIVRHRLIPFAW